jgi:2'-5' RNA ligase
VPTPSKPASRRLFLGLLPPADVRAAVVEAARPVLSGMRGGVHAAEDLHLTLCFLGQVEESRLSCLRSELAGALASARAVHLRVGGTGVFPTPGKERTAWAGLETTPEERAGLLDLVRRCREAATAAGVDWKAGGAEAPLATFVPHLTLARPRAPGGLPPAFAGLRFDRAWTADAVLLFESAGAGDPRGRYPVLARWMLAAG